MRPETWTAVREAFSAILALPVERRTELLDSLPTEVREEVRSLLEAHESAGSFLEGDDGGGGPPLGSAIGAYRILEKLGQGGMGVVFRAERNDGEFRREVAIKLMGGGHFAPDAERRFLFERQVLARLDHPHIVRMLDGGIADGRRYLVMELVSGEPLVQYCQGRRLGTIARLSLFRDVCDAISHAHRNLVIHRDIKPGNILVTGQGDVKVLDFGVAQLAGSDDSGPATHVLMRPMTLAYASPEQARGELLTVATDIYSLGVLLYELLAGENPQAPGELTLDRALDRICKHDPPRLPRQYPADLNAIAHKAMAKDPRARYGSASELLADIDRFLDGRPVLAQPPALRYAAWKFVRRNPWLSAVTAALVISLLAGFAAFAWQHRIAEQERTLAQNRFLQARRLIYTVIFEIQPRLESLPGATAIRAQLLDSTLRYLQEMEKNAGSDPGFLRELAGSYAELARVQGDMGGANVGAPAAARSLESAQRLIRQLLEIAPRNPGALSTAVFVYRQSATQYLQRGDSERGRDFARRAVDAARMLVDVQPSNENRQSLANALFAQANALRDPDAFEQALAIYEVQLKRTPDDVELLRDCALVHKNLSSVFDARKSPRALDEAQKALDIDRRLLAARPADQRCMLDVAIDLSQVSSSYETLGKLREAMSFAAQSIQLREQIFAANPDDVRALDRLAFAVSMQAFYKADMDLSDARQDLLRAESLYRRLAARTLPPAQSIGRFAHVELLLGELEKQGGKNAPACEYLRRSVDLFAKTKSNLDARFSERAAREEASCRKQ